MMAVDSGQPHAQTWVKVNAPVDRAIAELVLALSKIDGLETIESCQDAPGHGNAFVFFRYGTWEECGVLMFDELLPMLEPDLRASVQLILRAYDADSPMGEIIVEPVAIPALSKQVCRLASSRRTSRCSCDTSRT